MRLLFGGIPSTDVPLREEIRVAAQAGFIGLDVWVPKLDAYLGQHSVVLLDDQLRSNGVHIAALSGMEPIPLHSKAEFLMIQAQFLEVCPGLDALGGGIIVISAGLLPDWKAGEKEVTALAVRALQDLSSLAAPFEVNIALEFRSAAHSSVCTLAHSQEIVRLVARSNVGLALDTLQLFLSGSAPQEIEMSELERLWFVRLRDGEEPSREARLEDGQTLLGQGVVPLSEICVRLVGKGFQGPYSVAMPVLSRPPAETAASSRKSALTLLTE